MLHRNNPAALPPKALLRIVFILTIALLFLPAAKALANGNTAPLFLDTTTRPIVYATDGFYNLVPILHVNDPDITQTLTWSCPETSQPSHGTLTFTTATGPASSDATPLGTINYTPHAGYTGTDGFLIEVSDGITTTTREVYVTVYAASSVWDGGHASEFATGTGTLGDPYIIATAHQLAYFADYVNAGGTEFVAPYFRLKADIDLNQVPWDPIGYISDTADPYFQGYFDGDHHTISHVTIGSAEAPRNDLLTYGLFGNATNGEIRELNLVDVHIDVGTGSDTLYIGGLVGAFYPGGYVDNENCLIEQVSVSGSIHGGNNNTIGLLTGYIQGEVNECSSAGSVFSGTSVYAGGLVGFASAEAPFDGCFNTASVYIEGESESVAGGLIGFAQSVGMIPAVLDKSYSTGNVISQETSYSVDAILGYYYDSLSNRYNNVYFNKEAYMVNGNDVAPITTYGGNYGEVGLSFSEMQTTLLATLNGLGGISWDATTAPENLGLPKLQNLPVNLGTLPRITYSANDATSGTAPIDTGSYRSGEPIVLADNRLALSKGLLYTFEGWNTTANADGLAYAEFAPYTVNNAATLYATFDSIYTDPVIIEAHYPAAGNYSLGQNLDFLIQFDQPVYVTGELNLNIDFGNGYFPLALFSGSGSDILRFRYVVVDGDESAVIANTRSAIQMGSLSLAAGGKVTNATNDPAVLTYGLDKVYYRESYLDAKGPTMVSVAASPASGTQPLGRPLYFQAQYHEAITLDTSLGAPNLPMQIGGQNRIATYAADYSDLGNGQLTFVYTLASGDAGPVTLASAIVPNGAKLYDTRGNQALASAWTLVNTPDLSTLSVDAVGPTATFVNFYANHKNSSYRFAYGDDIIIDVSFNEVVTAYVKQGSPMLELQLSDSSSILLPYVSGTGTSILRFQGSLNLFDKHSAGVVLSQNIQVGVGNSIVDASGNAIDPAIPLSVVPDLGHVLLDSESPYMTTYTLPVQTTYGIGDPFDLVVNYNEVVYVNAIYPYPSVLCTLNTPTFDTNIYAYYTAGHGTTALTFRFTVPEGVLDTNGPSILGQLMVQGNSVVDAAGNVVNDALLPVDLSPYVFDGIETEVEQLRLTDLPGKTSFKIGDVMHFEMQFTEAVEWKTVLLDLADAAIKVYFHPSMYVMVPYVSGSGSDTWLFEYTVQPGDYAPGSLSLGVNPMLTTANGWFTDALNHPFDGSYNTVIVQDWSGVTVDGVRAQISQLVLPANGSYYPGQSLDFVVRYDEPVQAVASGVAGDYTIALKLYLDSGVVYVPLTGYWDTTAQAISLTPKADLLFRYTVGASDHDANGIGLEPEVVPLFMAEPYLHSGTQTLQDLAGNTAYLHFSTVNTSGIKLVDPPPPPEEPVVVKPMDKSPDTVLVNGEEKPLGILKKEVSGEAGERQTLRVDKEETQSLLEQTQQNIKFSLLFAEVSKEYAGALNGETVKLMERKNTVIELKTPKATYILPAHQIHIDSVAEQLGRPNDLQNIEVRVEVADTKEEQVQCIRQAASEQKVQIVVPPVDFTIRCYYGDQVVEVKKFSGYVSRMILIPDDVDPMTVTTAVVMHSDGSFGHVPTRIVVVDGKYYAQIHSLTNSSYVLVQNPVGLDDVKAHWAEEAITDMAARMIVSGMGGKKYEPERVVTRAEFVTMLVRALGLEGQGSKGYLFNDVADDDWFAGAFRVAHEYGLVAGDALGLALPYAELTREQAVAMLERAVKLAKVDVAVGGEAAVRLEGFADGVEVAEYAREAMAYFVQEGLVVGRAGLVAGHQAALLAPRSTLTRAEAAVLLQRALQHCNLID